MKKTILLILSLVILTVMGLTLNTQSVSAMGEGIQIVSKVGQLSEDGNSIIYTYIVKALGNEDDSSDIDTIHIHDTKFVNPIPLTGVILHPQQTALPVTATYTITQNDRNLGYVTNVATAHAYVKGTNYLLVSLSVPYTIPLPSAITLVKAGIWKLDNTIDYQFTVENTGVATLTNVALNDLPVFPISWTPPWPSGTAGTLNSGDVVIATGTYTVTDGSTTHVENTATVTAKDPSGNNVTASATCILDKNTGSIDPVPELPAGLLLGIGLAGIGTFIVIRRKKGQSKIGV